LLALSATEEKESLHIELGLPSHSLGALKESGNSRELQEAFFTRGREGSCGGSIRDIVMSGAAGTLGSLIELLTGRSKAFD
jgi:hypothetical protein